MQRYIRPWQDTRVRASRTAGNRPAKRAPGTKIGRTQLEKLFATLLEELRDAAILPDDRCGLEVVETIDRVAGASGTRPRRMVNISQYQELPTGLDRLAGGGSE